MPAHIIWIQSPTPASHSTIFCWSLHHQIQITSETCEGLSTPSSPHALPHTATHCNTLQHTATQMQHTRNTLQHTATHCNTLQHTATHCNTLPHTAIHCYTLQTLHLLVSPPQNPDDSPNNLFTTENGEERNGRRGRGSGGVGGEREARHCNTLQHTATHCNRLHSAAPHCITL